MFPPLALYIVTYPTPALPRSEGHPNHPPTHPHNRRTDRETDRHNARIAMAGVLRSLASLRRSGGGRAPSAAGQPGDDADDTAVAAALQRDAMAAAKARTADLDWSQRRAIALPEVRSLPLAHRESEECDGHTETDAHTHDAGACECSGVCLHQSYVLGWCACLR
jgi:hypothetical protein